MLLLLLLFVENPPSVNRKRIAKRMGFEAGL